MSIHPRKSIYAQRSQVKACLPNVSSNHASPNMGNEHHIIKIAPRPERIEEEPLIDQRWEGQGPYYCI